MKIKTSQFKFVAVLIMVLSASVLLSPYTGAQASQTSNPILSSCQERAPKAKDACTEGVDQALNKASYACEKAKKPNQCINAKAAAWIKKATKGKPDEKKFKSNLKKILDKQKGSASTFNPKIDKDADSDAKDVTSFFGNSDAKNVCGGSNSEQIKTRFNFGCLGDEADNSDLSPILDLLYSFIRFLSAGVGIVVVGAIILAGIQYSTSEGKPDATAAAKGKIQSAIVGLILYIFAFSLVQFLVPGGLFT